jgi:hypothetical protein
MVRFRDLLVSEPDPSMIVGPAVSAGDPIARSSLDVHCGLGWPCRKADGNDRKPKIVFRWRSRFLDINPGNVPTTAEGFGGDPRDPNRGGGPLPNEDAWALARPGDGNITGDFASVTADISADGTETSTARQNPNNVDNDGPQISKA